jgi:hypothetical protein
MILPRLIVESDIDGPRCRRSVDFSSDAGYAQSILISVFPVASQTDDAGT